MTTSPASARAWPSADLRMRRPAVRHNGRVPDPRKPFARCLLLEPHGACSRAPRSSPNGCLRGSSAGRPPSTTASMVVPVASAARATPCFLWDRWFGADRSIGPRELSSAEAPAMRRILHGRRRRVRPAAHQQEQQPPPLGAFRRRAFTAGDVSVPHARNAAVGPVAVSCPLRNPWLAGNAVRRRCQDLADPVNPVQSVCDQARYYDEVNRRQAERLGAERFWLGRYEEFCHDPGALVGA